MGLGRIHLNPNRRSGTGRDPEKCVALPTEFPPSTPKEYCSADGIQVMRDLLQGLRSQPVGRA